MINKKLTKADVWSTLNFIPEQLKLDRVSKIDKINPKRTIYSKTVENKKIEPYVCTVQKEKTYLLTNSLIKI